MKNTIIALSLASVFAAPAMAAINDDVNNYGNINDVVKSLADNDVKAVEGKYGNTDLYTKDGHHIGTVKNNGNGNYVVIDQNEGGRFEVEVDRNGDIKTIDGKERFEESKMPDLDDTAENRKAIDDIRNDVDKINEDANKVIDDAASEYNRDAKSAQNWAAQAEQQFKQEIGRLDNKIDTVEGRVSNGAAMTGAMSQMQFGHSGLGVGAGVSNFNGSNAIAVGVGYAFGNEKQWMAKGSLGYAKSNKGSGSEDTMAAAGLTYSFN